MYEFIDKTAEQSGTKLNRKAFMAMQGFVNKTTKFNADGSISETSSEGHGIKTIFNDDGSITEIFAGEKILKKTTMFNSDGSITEVIK